MTENVGVLGEGENLRHELIMKPKTDQKKHTVQHEKPGNEGKEKRERGEL